MLLLFAVVGHHYSHRRKRIMAMTLLGTDKKKKQNCYYYYLRHSVCYWFFLLQLILLLLLLRMSIDNIPSKNNNSITILPCVVTASSSNNINNNQPRRGGGGGLILPSLSQQQQQQQQRLIDAASNEKKKKRRKGSNNADYSSISQDRHPKKKKKKFKKSIQSRQQQQQQQYKPTSSSTRTPSSIRTASSTNKHTENNRSIKVSSSHPNQARKTKQATTKKKKKKKQKHDDDLMVSRTNLDVSIPKQHQQNSESRTVKKKKKKKQLDKKKGSISDKNMLVSKQLPINSTKTHCKDENNNHHKYKNNDTKLCGNDSDFYVSSSTTSVASDQGGQKQRKQRQPVPHSNSVLPLQRGQSARLPVDANMTEEVTNVPTIVDAASVTITSDQKVIEPNNRLENIIAPQTTMSSSSSNSMTPWVRRLLSKVNDSRRYSLLLPIPRDYISDNFNLVQLPSIIERIGRYYKDKEEQELKAARGGAINTNSSNNDDDDDDDRRYESNVPQQPMGKYAIYRQALQLLVDDHPLLFIGAATPLSSIDEENRAIDINNSNARRDHAAVDFYNATPNYLNKAATALYLLLHQRYVLSPRGLEFIRRKFIASDMIVSKGKNDNGQTSRMIKNPVFGRCPRQQCCGMPLLPIGDSDHYSLLSENEVDDDSHNDDNALSLLLHNYKRGVKLYCACCNEIFYDWEEERKDVTDDSDDDLSSLCVIDGCAWGTSFCHLFLMVYGEELFQPWLCNNRPIAITSSSTTKSYSPRIFGIPLHPSSVPNQFRKQRQQ